MAQFAATLATANPTRNTHDTATTWNSRTTPSSSTPTTMSRQRAWMPASTNCRCLVRCSAVNCSERSVIVRNNGRPALGKVESGRERDRLRDAHGARLVEAGAVPQLPGGVLSPAHDRAVRPQGAGVGVPGAHLRERSKHVAPELLIQVGAPARDGRWAPGAHQAGVPAARADERQAQRIAREGRHPEDRVAERGEGPP